MNFCLAEIGIFSIFCLEYYYYYKLINKLHKNKLTEKQKSYILSLKNSITMTLASVFYIYLFINSSFKLSLNKDNTIFGNLLVLYFIAYLFMDLFIGIFEYPKCIELLSGYIHHSSYILISSLAIYYDNVLFIFMLAMFEELPTFLLALGSFNKSFRNDKLFGITFFMTRIVYHSILLFLFKNNNLVFYVGSASLILHLFWFKNWWFKYGNKIFIKKKKLV